MTYVLIALPFLFSAALVGWRTWITRPRATVTQIVRFVER